MAEETKDKDTGEPTQLSTQPRDHAASLQGDAEAQQKADDAKLMQEIYADLLACLQKGLDRLPVHEQGFGSRLDLVSLNQYLRTNIAHVKARMQRTGRS